MPYGPVLIHAMPYALGPRGGAVPALEPTYHPIAPESPEPSPKPSSLPLGTPSTAASSYPTRLPSPRPPALDARDSLLIPDERGATPFRPAPSLRSSTYSGLQTPEPGYRASWGSSVALGPNEAAIAGAERPSTTRGTSSLRDSLGSPDPQSDDEQGHIAPAAAAAAVAAAAPVDEKAPAWATDAPRRSRKGLCIALGAGGVVLVALAVGLGVGLTRHTKAGNSSAAVQASGSSAASTASGTATATSSSAAPSATATSGGFGSLLTFEDGSTMTYNNAFGGTWVYDAANPFNNEAQCNSWTPALKQNWTWGVDKVYGVNIGGWLNTEPFIVPALYQKYANGTNGQTAVDEYTLSQNMGDNLTTALTEHYETFITERDFAEIASAGLNWVRLPLPHWAIETWPGEPYLERVSWTYFLKAIGWARKYGLRINLDLHTVPGSQNGWNHSGHLGLINWLYGVMGMANAQRSLDYIRTLAQFISQPEYAPVIQLFGFINEPNAGPIGQQNVGSFYREAYETIRAITGIGEGNGAFLSMHDGFLGLTAWNDFLPGADRLALDQHPYLVFQNQPTGSLSDISKLPCSTWANATNTTQQTFGVLNAGEWAAAPNDCGLWVNGVNLGQRYDGTYAGFENSAIGSCDYWNDYTQWNASTKASILFMAQATQDALQSWFYWTWKIGNSTEGNVTEPNPFWHYRLGLQHGWIPADPRDSVGTCVSIGTDLNAFDGTFASAYMTGGPGAGTIAAAQTSSYPWPPKSFTNVASASMSSLPQYTQTATPITMPAATYTSPGSGATISAGSGWFNANDDARSAYAAVSGCTYPSEYFAATSAITAGECGAGLSQPTKRAAAPA
ncbi:hypothetical protein Q5752_003746 [Cryptotrichosporon argae]